MPISKAVSTPLGRRELIPGLTSGCIGAIRSPLQPRQSAHRWGQLHRA